jgi:hypothetical protein
MPELGFSGQDYWILLTVVRKLKVHMEQGRVVVFPTGMEC